MTSTAKYPLNIKKEVEHLFQTTEYEKLYMVRVLMENDTAGTDVWSIYPTKELAKAYVKRLKLNAMFMPGYKKLGKYEYEYIQGEEKIRQKVVGKIYKRAA